MPSGAAPVLRGFESWVWYRRFFRDPLLCLSEAHRQFGSISVFESPIPGPRYGQRYVLAVGAEMNRRVLGAPDDFRAGGQVVKGPPGSAQRRLRRGLLAMYDEKHLRHRRLMRPPFSKPAVASSIALMAPLIDEIINRWQVGQLVDMFDEMRALSNWVSANVLFGNEDLAYSLHLGRMIDRWVALDTATRRLGLIELDLPGTPYRRELKHAERLEETIRKFIAQKRQAKAAGADVLSMLIRAVDSAVGMSEADVIAHAIALYGASFETTASALAWTMFLIAQHPSYAAQLHDEVSTLTDWPPDSQELDSLAFLDAIICESMRLMPPVPMTVRRPLRRLELGGLELGPRDKVVLSHFLTHRDPAVFPRPNRFDPLRWFTSCPDHYQYIPFSAGSRICLGANFAMAELKLAVARVMQKYRLTVVPGTRIDGTVQFVLKPGRGLPMVVHPQDRAFRRSPVKGNVQQLVDLASPDPTPLSAAALH